MVGLCPVPVDQDFLALFRCQQLDGLDGLVRVCLHGFEHPAQLLRQLARIRFTESLIVVDQLGAAAVRGDSQA